MAGSPAVELVSRILLRSGQKREAIHCLGERIWKIFVAVRVQEMVGHAIASRPAVIAREGGRSSIPEAEVRYGEAAEYWIPRFRRE
jgi:hypothetical protein